MLTIQNADVLDEKKLNVTRRKTKKTQILLYDTQRRLDDFMSKLKYRKNGRYGDIPHFVVSKLGVVYQIFNTDYSSATFNDPNLDKRQIKIAVENLGWLNKNTINGLMTNWVGDPYRSEPYIRNWRERFYWDTYTEQQMLSLSLLCDHICDKHNISKRAVPSQGFIENVPNFKGIVCKSNFSNIYTDINPSFNFSILFNHDKEKNNGI
jgi:hypothetical protein